jgi:ElaB/YqjD/DUF883 family membrane-anchored ribosome-binding protein
MNTLNGRKAKHLGDAAEGLLKEGKKFAHELYEEGLHQMSETEESVKEYSDELLKKVQKNPLASLLIAGGVGFVLSLLLKK